jgi:shikimate dehydrogenase
LTTRLAVLGSPIAHSRSPLLHRAAYEVLGLDWQYSAVEVSGDTLRDFVESRDVTWRGLSLTMPLKRDVLPLLSSLDRVAELTGAANTVVLADRRGYNTDVFGITQAFRRHGVESLGLVHVLGGGATAASALAAVADLGATRVQFALRDPSKGEALRELGAALSVEVEVVELGSSTEDIPDAVISTLPGHSEHSVQLAEPIRQNAVLFDVAYDPWPSALASQWLGTVISGLDMLTLQALAQVRIFVGGDPSVPLPNESEVLAAMERAVTP